MGIKVYDAPLTALNDEDSKSQPVKRMPNELTRMKVIRQIRRDWKGAAHNWCQTEIEVQ